MWATSSVAEATPRTTLMRLRSIDSKRPRVASARARLATMRERSCAVSVAWAMFGGRPNSSGSKSTPERKPPRVVQTLSGVPGRGSK